MSVSSVVMQVALLFPYLTYYVYVLDWEMPDSCDFENMFWFLDMLEGDEIG